MAAIFSMARSLFIVNYFSRSALRSKSVGSVLAGLLTLFARADYGFLDCFDIGF